MAHHGEMNLVLYMEKPDMEKRDMEKPDMAHHELMMLVGTCWVRVQRHSPDMGQTVENHNHFVTKVLADIRRVHSRHQYRRLIISVSDTDDSNNPYIVQLSWLGFITCLAQVEQFNM